MKKYTLLHFNTSPDAIAVIIVLNETSAIIHTGNGVTNFLGYHIPNLGNVVPGESFWIKKPGHTAMEYQPPADIIEQVDELPAKYTLHTVPRYKETAFITGPTEGLDKLNIEEFILVQEMLQNLGYAAVIPHELYDGIDVKAMGNEELIDLRHKAIRKSDCVILLEGWQNDNYSFRDEEAASLYGLKIHQAKNILSQYAEAKNLH